ESARWGEGRTRDDEWRFAVSFLDGKLDGNVQVFMDALRNWGGLYPDVIPPTFNQHGGRTPAGFHLVMSGSDAIYYSLEGEDPRLPGGAIAPSAKLYSQPLPLARNS